ncbi:MAG: cytochrome c [Pseudomonadota bacterium]
MFRVLILSTLAITIASCSNDRSTQDTADRDGNAATESAAPVAGGPFSAPPSSHAQPMKPFSVDELYNTPEKLYAVNCGICHAEGDNQAGTRRLANTRGEEYAVLVKRSDLHVDYVTYIVRHGLNMMPAFRPSELTDEEVSAIAEYIVAQSPASE